MCRALGLVSLALSLSACVEAYPPGENGAGGGPGSNWCGTEGPDLPIVVGTPLRLLDATGLTSHALAPAEAGVVAVATRETPSPDGTRTTLVYTVLDGEGRAAEARPLELYFPDVTGLRVGTAVVDEPLVFLAMATDDTLYTHQFEIADGSRRTGGSSGGVGIPERPLQPSAVTLPLGFFSISNDVSGISAEVVVPGGYNGYDGFYAGYDPYVVRAGDDVWLGWNQTDGARVARLQGTQPPLPGSPIELGPAESGPVLAAGPDGLLALTWGDALVAHRISLDPPALAATSTVTAGPIAGRPAALPLGGGFLVLWADPAGTVLHGRLLDPAGQPLGSADGFVVLGFARPISFEPTHVVGDADGAWLSYESATGLEAVPLARAR
jgi:hypothetical protein